MKPTKEYNGRSRIRMFNADCMEFMEDCDKYDLAIVDPPYGLGEKLTSGGTWASKYSKSDSEWDNKIPDEYYFKSLFDSSENQIIWGGNYFKLPKNRCFIIWDKVAHMETLADCEYAWASFDKNAKIFKHVRNTSEKRIHITQKPVQLYKWLLSNYGPECKYCRGLGSYDEDIAGDGGSCMRLTCDECNGTGKGKILDTHGGSMSIAIACWDLGFDLDIIELDEDYFNDAVKRFENHISQTQLF